VTALRGFSEMCLEKCNERGILYATGLWKAGEAENSHICRMHMIWVIKFKVHCKMKLHTLKTE